MSVSTGYHHGDLPSALRGAAVALLAERGPASFSLREVARRAGVSHAAPAHHFGDSRGLLSSVAAEGYATLATAMRNAVEGIDDPVKRLNAIGMSYIETARMNPGHYAVMLNHDFTDPEHDELLTSGTEAYGVLIETVELLRDVLKPDLDIDATATLLWAGVHGLVELLPNLDHMADNHLEGGTPEIDCLVSYWADMVVFGLQSRDN